MDIPSKSSSAAEADRLLAEWEQRSLLASLAHARSANRSAAWDLRLGLVSASVTAIVGTAIFASIAHDVSTLARIIAGAVSVLAAVLTAVRTFAAPGQRKEAYERASRRHSAVRRQIEVVRTQLAAGEAFDVWARIEEVRIAGDEAAADSPNASPRLFDRTRREMKNELTWWDKLRRLA
ncbi:MAG TPA: SLATT domain-containing protein, partial [Solirubrobacteraceae bacterium]